MSANDWLISNYNQEMVELPTRRFMRVFRIGHAAINCRALDSSGSRGMGSLNTKHK